MKNTLFLAAALFILTATAVAQQKEAPTCTTRILLLNQNWYDQTQTRPLMSPDQTKWWLEDGQKKFKNFCFVSASQSYDYRIVWTDTDTFRTAYEPTTTTTTGEVSAGGRKGTYSETSTNYAGRKVTYRTTYVQIRLLKADAETEPLFNELHKGQWVWSKPDRAALENALKALAKLEKKAKQ